MQCFSELTYSIFVDGELPADEAQRVRTHLAACASCREMVAALTAENKMLLATMSDVAADHPAPATSAERPAWIELLGVATVLALVGIVTHWLNLQTSNGAANWLNPFTSEGRSNLAFNLVFYLSHGGGNVLEQLASMIGWLLLLIATAWGLFALARHQRFRSGFLLAALAVAFSLPGMAIERRNSKSILTIQQNETINDTLLASAETVEIEGNVKGDLFTAARSIVVHGSVSGNIFCWSQNVEVDGSIGGSVFGFAQNLTVRGQVGHSVYAWVEFLHLEPGSRIASDVVLGSQEASLQGKVDGGVMAFAGAVNVHGDIGRNILAYVGELNLNSPTHVGGGVKALVKRRSDVRVADGVTIGGPMEINLHSHRSRYASPGYYVWRAISLVGAFVIGWILMYLFPGFFQRTSRAVGAGWRSFGLGFAVLIVTPVAIILIALTLIGLPLALIALGLYLICLYLSLVFVGAFFGWLLFKTDQPRGGRSLWAYFVGLLILTVLVSLPIIGTVFKLLACCLGLGALVSQLYRSWRPATA